MNVTILSGSNEILNLGLIPIHNSLTSRKIVKMVDQKLNSYNLSLESDIVCMITDGAKVMSCLGKLIPTLQQLCLAHGIQLAVTDVLYPKRKDLLSADPGLYEPDVADVDADSDNQDTDFGDSESEDTPEDDEETKSYFILETESSETDIEVSHFQYNALITKARKIVNQFKRSPLKNEKLQEYAKTEFGKEVSLLMDSKTRWSSLFTMLQRFCKLKSCIMKSQIDLQLSENMEDWEFSGLQQLVEALEPLKVTVERICRRDADLFTTDVALNFAIQKLETANTPISLELSVALRRRILERRTDASSVLQYLKFGQMEQSLDEELFKRPSKAKITDFIKCLIMRLNPATDIEIEAETESQEDESNIPKKQKKSDLQSELEQAVVQMSQRAHKPKTQNHEKTLLATIKKEMSMFEGGGLKGVHLELAFKYLMVIVPSSVESERVFSSAGYLCNKIRSSLNDETLSELSFLRSIFQLND